MEHSLTSAIGTEWERTPMGGGPRGTKVKTASLCWSLAASMMFSFLLAVPALSDDEYERQSLVGLKGVALLVEELGAEAEKAGLSRSTFQTDVELKLRQAGIRILSVEEQITTPGAPYLYLNVNVLKLQSGYVYDAGLFLRQSVFLAPAPKTLILAATTWQALGVTGTIGPNNLGRIREKVKDLVDQFLNAYLAANPKRSS
jgi:hypothetical protein